jgi:hypothetical protein
MEENYFDPERFRLNLNSFVQEARNVTFILQKNKKELPRFEEWYAGWQDKLKADRILRWIVESRNRITKQGDLEIKSECFVIFTTDWTDEFSRRFKGNPLTPSPVLAKQVLMQITQDSIKWVVIVGEAWYVEDTNGRPLQHASEMPDRKEALMINGVSCDGSFINSMAVFNRHDGKITVEDWKNDQFTANILLPIYKAIRTPVQQTAKSFEK